MRLKFGSSLLVCLVLLLGIAGGSVAAPPQGRHVLERRASPPNVVGLKLPIAGERLRASGWIPRPFNTDTLFGIVIPSHYTVCREYQPIGKRVRLLAQKYGC